MKRRLIVQMGMGVGETVQHAAERAIADAQGRARVLAEAEFKTRITLGVPEAVSFDPQGLSELPGAEGVSVQVVPGGMRVAQGDGVALIVVSAAIEVLPLDAET